MTQRESLQIRYNGQKSIEGFNWKLGGEVPPPRMREPNFVDEVKECPQVHLQSWAPSSNDLLNLIAYRLRCTVKS